MGKKYVLALDQGTTSSRSILFDHDAQIIASAQEEFEQYYPRPGWVEHDPEAIWQSQKRTAIAVVEKSGVDPKSIAAIGITNQRETTLLWERATGKPLHNAIVWQCRRTVSHCERLRSDGHEALFREKTGLVLDAYFSGTKLCWLLQQDPSLRKRAVNGELCFGTVDSWLLYKLTGNHTTDLTNASRTLMFNINTLEWDDELLSILDIPASLLPEVRPTSHHFGNTRIFGPDIPVTALVGDQQSALFGQTAFNAGDCKNTYGTGCFMLMNTGERPVTSSHGLLTTIAWGMRNQVEYALEGSVFVAGAVIQWLRDELQLLKNAAESEAIASLVSDTGGVYVVPAFVGLGAPYWDMRAQGTICGLSRGTNRSHLVRAALESISFQSADVLHAMEMDSGITISELRADGGASANNLLMQHQADVLGISVLRSTSIEATALGAAFLAGLAVGFWEDESDIKRIGATEDRFEPHWDSLKRGKAIQGWKAAVNRTRSIKED